MRWPSMLLLCLALSVFAREPLAKGELIKRVTCRENPGKSYALYVPTSYDPQKPAPLLLLFEPAARAPLPLEFFRDAAEFWGFIVACSYDTPNYTPWEENRIGVQAMWNDVLQRFRIDNHRMYVGGLSGGARLASRVAFVTDGVAGLVACGAGFWLRDSNAAPPDFEVVSTAGTADFNYLELYDLEKELNRRGLANRRIIFDGGHLWPGSEDCFEIMAWLQSRAYRRGLISVEAVRAAEQLSRRADMAAKIAEKGDLFLAERRYRQLIEDLEGLVDLASVQKNLDALADDNALKQAAKQEKRSLGSERQQQRKLISRLKSGEKNAANKPALSNREYAFWKGKGEALIRQSKDEANIFQARTAQRLLALLRANIYESSVYHLREKAYREVLFINKVGEEISPRSPSPPYNRAIAYAGLGQFDNALEELEEAIKRGFRDVARIRADQDMALLKKDARFQALLKRYEAKQ